MFVSADAAHRNGGGRRFGASLATAEAELCGDIGFAFRFLDFSAETTGFGFDSAAALHLAPIGLKMVFDGELTHLRLFCFHTLAGSLSSARRSVVLTHRRQMAHFRCFPQKRHGSTTLLPERQGGSVSASLSVSAWCSGGMRLAAGPLSRCTARCSAGPTYATLRPVRHWKSALAGRHGRSRGRGWGACRVCGPSGQGGMETGKEKEIRGYA